MIIPDEDNELLTRALGEAAVRFWSRLPHEVQQQLFEEAVTFQDESIRHPLAIFLHYKHSRTTDAIKARAAFEPDSLGG